MDSGWLQNDKVVNSFNSLRFFSSYSAGDITCSSHVGGCQYSKRNRHVNTHPAYLSPTHSSS